MDQGTTHVALATTDDRKSLSGKIKRNVRQSTLPQGLASSGKCRPVRA